MKSTVQPHLYRRVVSLVSEAPTPRSRWSKGLRRGTKRGNTRPRALNPGPQPLSRTRADDQPAGGSWLAL